MAPRVKETLSSAKDVMKGGVGQFLSLSLLLSPQIGYNCWVKTNDWQINSGIDAAFLRRQERKALHLTFTKNILNKFGKKLFDKFFTVSLDFLKKYF